MDGSVCWARLEPADECKVSEFINSLDSGKGRLTDSDCM